MSREFDKWWKKWSWEGTWDYEEYAEAGWIAATEHHQAELSAVNKENERLIEAIEAAMRIKDLWLPDSNMLGDEYKDEATALTSMMCKFDEILKDANRQEETSADTGQEG